MSSPVRSRYKPQRMKRSLLLNGFMATGKSTVAKVLSQRTGVASVDLDARIVSRAGKPIADIFSQDGEARFRELERAELDRLLASSTPQIVALGGGALLRRSVRLDAVERSVVVTLRARPATILQRTAGKAGRPLLVGLDEAGVDDLLAAREMAYAEAHQQVDVDGRTPEEVAGDVLQVWQRDPVGVLVGSSSYSVEVGSGFASERAAEVSVGASRVVLLTDQTVGGLYAADYLAALSERKVMATVFQQAPGEEHKTLGSLERIWMHCLSQGVDRKSVFVGLGGGVMTDIAGFAAATWMRGVPWVSVPTTLLGMVDASVGGKTAVDLPGAKNCVGAFWQPQRVLCDVAHLQSEPSRGVTGALAEVVKTALLGDAEMFSLLEEQSAKVVARDWGLIEQLVRRCIAVKASVVSRDEREGGLRAALNLGHTVGHALEAQGGFGGLSHGEAVSLGLVAALRIGVQLGITPAELSQRTTRLLAALGLPTDLSVHPLAEASVLLGHDKKRGGDSVRFVFCPEPGRTEFKKLGIGELQSIVSALG